MASLSVLVITKNEEKNIVECLKTVTWADEIVVVDGGSTDKTVVLAGTITPKVFERKWDGYGAAKNFGLSQCTSEWVLWLDADERVPAALADEIRNIIQSNPSQDGFEVPRRANFLGSWINHCGWYPGYVCRLFRRVKGRFTERKVHEKLEVEGNVGRLSSDLLHYTDPTFAHYFEKFNRYTSLAAEELYERGERFSLAQVLIRPAWVFFRMYVLRGGFLDGLPGFVLCVVSAFYVFTKYAKLWEISLKNSRS